MMKLHTDRQMHVAKRQETKRLMKFYCKYTTVTQSRGSGRRTVARTPSPCVHMPAEKALLELILPEPLNILKAMAIALAVLSLGTSGLWAYALQVWHHSDRSIISLGVIRSH
jgi:hypothetical protein